MPRAFTAFGVFVVFVVILSTYLVGQTVGPRTVKFKSHYESPLSRDKPRTEKLHYQDNSSVESNQESKRMADSLQARSNMLIEQCGRLEQNGSEFHTGESPRFDRIIVNDKYRVLYCFIPKVACTNLKRIFLILTGKIKKTDPLEIKRFEVHSVPRNHFTYLHTLSAENIQYRLKHYRKVIFVREPLVRLLSAYRDKLTHGGKHLTKLHGSHAIRLFRENPSQKSLEEGHDLKFSEFVDYILYLKAHSQKFDKHWDTYFNLCSPCHINYDFIGKLETLDEDVELLLKEMEADQLVRFPKREESYTDNKTEDVLKKFYGLIDPQKITQLQDVYRLDYLLFGYQMPEARKKLIGPSK